MKQVIIFLLLIISVVVNSQSIGSRCAVCPPSLHGVSTGWVLTDSAGVPRWQVLPINDTINEWSLTGNSGTTAGTNFIGTTDGAALFLASGSPLITAQSAFAFLSKGNGVAIEYHDSLTNEFEQIQLAGRTLRLGANNFANDTQAYVTLYKDSLTIAFNGSYYTLPTTTPAAGNVLTALTDNGSLSWQPLFNTPTQDSIAATGATVTLPLNGTKVITSAGAIVSATLAFPTGVTGNWIVAIFDQAIGTITNSGTGSGTATLVAPLKGTSKVYVNIGGNWK